MRLQDHGDRLNVAETADGADAARPDRPERFDQQMKVADRGGMRENHDLLRRLAE